MKNLLAAAIAALASAPAFANQPDISALVSDTIGYVNVAPNVVIFEGDNFDTFICRIDVSDEAFDAYLANGELGDNEVGYSCIPIEELEN